MPEVTEGFILTATAVGNMTETGHKVSQKYKFCLFTTHLSAPIAKVPETLFPLLDAVPHC